MNAGDMDRYEKVMKDGREFISIDFMLPPFEIDGFGWAPQDHLLSRLPENRLAGINEGVRQRFCETSGGMVRFKTDSPVIGIDIRLKEYVDMVHIPKTGSSGVDLYRGAGSGAEFFRVFYPGTTDHYEGFYGTELPDDGTLTDWTMNLPLYAAISKMNILLKPGSTILPPEPFAIAQPVVFYGSSITQGGCASRPGNAYTNILSRKLDIHTVNLGFSGSALGEIEMADLISELIMSAFVMDYDHNAPNDNHLERTHKPFFSRIREKHTTLPIIFISKPDFDQNTAINGRRRDIIMKTYNDAIESGDANVYFIDGQTLFGSEDRDACTVDGCHPNDIGFLRIALAILPVLRKALSL